MKFAIILFFCGYAVGAAQDEVILEDDVPFLTVPLLGKAVLKCCFSTSSKQAMNHTWFKQFYADNKTVGPHPLVNPSTIIDTYEKNRICVVLTFQSAKINDTGFYQCWLGGSDGLFTHGTYLQVYMPLVKTINLSESTKNKILTAEGILLLLCVLLPSVTLLFKSKRVNELEKKKVKKEEENIYQGLNLDDCCTTYDQIERSQANGPYQDVCNIIEEEEDIQLEKP